MKFANWYENCKLIWKLPSNSHVFGYGFYVDICNSHMRDTAGLKTCSGKEFLGWIAAWMTKTHREQTLTKPSTIHILILIPVIRQSDLYFKQWFLRSPIIYLGCDFFALIVDLPIYIRLCWTYFPSQVHVSPSYVCSWPKKVISFDRHTNKCYKMTIFYTSVRKFYMSTHISFHLELHLSPYQKLP